MTEEEEVVEEEVKVDEVKAPAPSLVEEAREAAKRIEDANERQERILARQEKLMAEQELGGKAEAGQKKEKEIEKTPEEFAEDFMNGKVPNPLNA